MLYIGWMAPDREHQVQSREISRAQFIPEHYLKHILADLKAHGHWLARPASEVTLADVLLAMEGQLTHIEDILLMPCQIEVGPEHCAIKEVWLRVKQAVEGILYETSLEDLVARQRALVSDCLPPVMPREAVKAARSAAADEAATG